MENESRYKLAYATLILAFFMLFLFIVLAMCKCTSLEAKEVMNAVLPLIATWVGAIIAFYFGKENFEAAQQQINKLLDKDTLDDIPVKNVMIHKKTMVLQKYDENKTLQEYYDFYQSVDKNRIPLIDESGKLKLIIHTNEFIPVLMKDSKKGEEENKLTLKDFLSQEKNKDNYGYNQKNGFITVSPDDSLESAMKKMKNLEDCKDIIITSDGTEQGKLIGWITDVLAYAFLNVK
jgi:CBS domain-containing protein